jgi:hypothetical protein
MQQQKRRSYSYQKGLKPRQMSNQYVGIYDDKVFATWVCQVFVVLNNVRHQLDLRIANRLECGSEASESK